MPATESQPEKGKRGVYQINDHFLRFWFRYVHPNQGSLELGLADSVLAQREQPDQDLFASVAFEEATREFIVVRARVGKLPFLPERTGSWWSRMGELDILAISPSGRTALVGECKWSVNPVVINILEDLKRRAAKIEQDSNIEHIHYALFSRRGFRMR